MVSGDYEKKKRKNPCVLIRKLIDLMEHPISKNSTERHLKILNEFLNSSHYAFWLRDIPYIIKLYEKIAQSLDSTPEFLEPIKCVLYFSAVPPIMMKVSDKLEYVRDFQEYFSILGYLILCFQNDDLKKLVLQAIKGLIHPISHLAYCCVPAEYCKQAAEKSRLPEILAQLLQIISNDLYPILLDVMYLICDISITACQKMVKENAIEFVLRRLEPTWRERNMKTKPRNPSSKDTVPTIDDACCVLWKLLSAVDKQKVNVKDPSHFALWSLQYAFRWSNICLGQKLNRNNLTAIILKIMMTFPTMDLLTNEISDDIEILATTAAGCGCRSSLKFTEDDLDFFFKKIMWTSLHYYHKFQLAYPVVKENEVMRAFLKNISQEHTTSKNHVEQYCQLSKIVLRIIPKFLPFSVELCMKLNGPTKVIDMIEGYLKQPYDLELLAAYMYCLSEMLMTGVEDVLTYIGKYDCFNIITGVCYKSLAAEALINIHQKILARGFCILEILCTTGYINNIGVITLCLTYLRRVTCPNQNDPIIDNRVTLCALHVLWECLFIDRQFYREFIKSGGIYAVLDVTEASTFPIKCLSLGILADTSKKPSCVPYFITWRKRGKGLIPMLLEIFRAKTERHCNMKQNIQLAEELPSDKNEWITLCHIQKKSFQGTRIPRKILLHKCRLRIHAILHALKVQFKERVEIANEHYKLFNTKLNTDNQLTMLFAENYLSLKMCRSWMNIAKQLKKEEIIPVASDSELLNEKVQRIQQWKFYLQTTFSSVIKNEEQNEQYNELETYKTLKEARLSDALDALKDLRYISNCTERMFQMRQKLILQQEVDSSKNIATANFHRTICELPFTNIYNQNISIQSNIVYEKKEEECPITPVSLESWECLNLESSDNDLSEPPFKC